MSDNESFTALVGLSMITDDHELADAINRVAQAFRRHDSEIYSTEVQALCP